MRATYFLILIAVIVIIDLIVPLYRDVLNPEASQANARELLSWINKAYTNCVIREGGGLFKKVDALEKRLAVLQVDYEELEKVAQKTADDNIAWQNKLEQSQEDYDKLLKTLSEEGGHRT